MDRPSTTSASTDGGSTSPSTSAGTSPGRVLLCISPSLLIVVLLHSGSGPAVRARPRACRRPWACSRQLLDGVHAARGLRAVPANQLDAGPPEEHVVAVVLPV